MLNWISSSVTSPSDGDVVFVRGGEKCSTEDGNNMGPHQVAIATFSDRQFCSYFHPENWYEPLHWALVPSEVVVALNNKLPQAVNSYLSDKRGVLYSKDVNKEPTTPTFASEGYDLQKLLERFRS